MATDGIDKRLDDDPERLEQAKPEDGLFVASLAKGFRVLESFDGGRSELSFAELVKRSGIGKSAAQRAVATLIALKYVVRDDTKRTYRISHRFLSLTRKFSTGTNLVDVGQAFINALHDQTGETINITERDDLDIIYVARVPGRHVVTISFEIGARLPVFATAPGLVMLAYESKDVAKNVLDRSEKSKFTKQTLTRMQDLMNCLREIQKDGYFISNQMRFEGEYSVAAPILGHDEIILGAVNASVPVLRWSEERLRSELVPLVVDTASKISEKLQHG